MAFIGSERDFHEVNLTVGGFFNPKNARHGTFLYGF
jgi:hypothetical protein